jgi:homogentisate 1,2-dioxygenase
MGEVPIRSEPYQNPGPLRYTVLPAPNIVRGITTLNPFKTNPPRHRLQQHQVPSMLME